MTKQIIDMLTTVLAGGLFGAGLVVSGMARPETVLDFLLWRDMGLLLVLGAAVMVTTLVYQLAPRLRPTSLLGEAYQRRPFVADRRSMAGAVLFGIGWGLSGVCPAPAVTSLGLADTGVWWALAGLLAGAGLHGWWMRRTVAA